MLLPLPALDELHLLGAGAITVHEPAPRHTTVHLHPHRCVQERRQLATQQTRPLHPHHVKVSGNTDGAVTAALVLRAWAVVDLLPSAQWLQHVLGQQVGPVEERVMPGDVIGVNHRRGRNGTVQLPSQG